MSERDLTEAISDQDISRMIHYLDPDCQKETRRNSHNLGFESVFTLILLLGSVLASLALILWRVSD